MRARLAKVARLNMAQAVLIGFVLIAAALYFGGVNPVASQSNKVAPRGPFAIAQGDENYVWRIDQATGAVSYCYRDTNSLDRVLIRDRPPYCSAWGN